MGDLNLSVIKDGHSNSPVRSTDITGMVYPCQKVETLLHAVFATRKGDGCVSFSELAYIRLALASEAAVPESESEELVAPLSLLPRVESDNANSHALTLVRAERIT